MSVYVGIDVHRKRSQVAVIDAVGEVLANRNVPNGVTPILSVIGDLPSGTPAAFEAAFGWGWLVELLEDYGFAPHLVHAIGHVAVGEHLATLVDHRHLRPLAVHVDSDVDRHRGPPSRARVSPGNYVHRAEQGRGSGLTPGPHRVRSAAAWRVGQRSG